ncbi:MAG: ABC transporter ATP-binding protein [Blautia sp.]|nr:ABC transporter ATP-binding protein [Blautia sp.]
MEDVIVKCEKISKIYKLYDKPGDRVKDALNLSKGQLYKEYFALSNVDMSISRGECVGIIGTNGAGKSTLLKIVTGVLRQSSGTVTVRGKISALLELGAGFNMEYTGIENIYINGRMTGYTRKEIDKKLQDILDFADIGDFVYQPVKTYSSGMFVRLAFAVAINIEPDILIVDEALAVGDVFFQSKCFKKFEEFKKQGKTILFVSHSLGTIQKYCDRAILLNKGQKLAEGKPKEIIDLYNKQISLEKKTDDKRQSQHETESVEVSSDSFWKDQLITNPEILEYGNKKAEIIDFALIDDSGTITNNIMKGSEFKICMKVRFYETIDEPIFAFTIKDLKGTELTGTNTLLQKIVPGTVEAGSIRVISFKQKMLLQSYEYLLCLGCTGFRDGELVVYHRLYDICNISVLANRDTIGVFDSNSEIEIG